MFFPEPTTCKKTYFFFEIPFFRIPNFKIRELITVTGHFYGS